MKLWHIILLAVITAGISGCSTTKRLGPDDVLYTGVKKTVIRPDSGQTLAPGVGAAIKSAVNVKPNNCLISPSIRYPFPWDIHLPQVKRDSPHSANLCLSG